MTYANIITFEPGKRSGQPCSRGLRITVYDLLSNLAAGMRLEEVLDDFPQLTREDILALPGFCRRNRTYPTFCESRQSSELEMAAKKSIFA